LIRAREILNAVDWTASSSDFRLAYAVLMENYDEAARLMQQIGRKGEFVNKFSYYVWPLFNEFRETEQFSTAYEKVYEHPYAEKLEEDAAATSKRAAEVVDAIASESDSGIHERVVSGEREQGGRGADDDPASVPLSDAVAGEPS